jgi:pyrroline-5-carboxylate reductase
MVQGKWRSIVSGPSRIIDPKNIMVTMSAVRQLLHLPHDINKSAISIQELSHKSDVIIIAEKPAIVASVPAN